MTERFEKTYNASPYVYGTTREFLVQIKRMRRFKQGMLPKFYCNTKIQVYRDFYKAFYQYKMAVAQLYSKPDALIRYHKLFMYYSSSSLSDLVLWSDGVDKIPFRLHEEA